MTRPQHQLSSDVMAALAQGKRIEAIKLLRKASGLGLAEAKAIIDVYRNQTDAHPPDHTFDRDGEWRQKGGPREEPSPVTPMSAAPAPIRSGLGPGEVPRSNSGFWLVLILMAVIVAYYLVGR